MNTRRLLLLAGAALAALAACSQEKTCAPGEVLCGGSCVATTDPDHCGACGQVCVAGQACQAGQCLDCAAACGPGQTCADRRCVADLYVACFATDQVMGMTGDLGVIAAQYRVDDGPIALSRGDAGLYVAHARSAAVIDLIVPGETAPRRFVLPTGSDLELVRARGGRVYGSNSEVNAVTVLDGTSGAVVDEISVAVNPGDVADPRGFDFVGGMAYVALFGNARTTPAAPPSYETSQQIVVIDFSAVPARIVKRISLDVPGSHDTDAFPFPTGVVAVGSRVFAALANLKFGEGLPGFEPAYVVPAGDGRLAVIDAADQDALSIVDLGPGCQNPAGLAASGTTVWVSCGSAAVAAAVVPVDVSGPVPVVGNPILTPSSIAGNVAICRGTGYVSDQMSGQVARFDPTGVAAPVAMDVCPLDPTAGFAFAADVTCGP